ncbi:hypothetical protein E4P41_08515 [Geodermatophilus sp. DF01-2]|uniref:hypothetical protein n=1 Tax=Geodermatophilus sp. DF01-2 TaxID=2559610 RepID=UPI0010745BD8|nr:hypothetical protein [Geodermatophilus sp. DF01_2]TFV62033.1 hypothetical protein E4P41_08515 [Geodermatophilus sp. DF01_2]
MNSETQEAQRNIEQETAWYAFQYWTGSQDETRFREAYMGRYASREEFGRQLLSSLGADGRLTRLPDWLQAYIRLDGEAVVRDFEQAGQLWVFDAPDHSGTYVFDGYS